VGRFFNSKVPDLDGRFRLNDKTGVGIGRGLGGAEPHGPLIQPIGRRGVVRESNGRGVGSGVAGD
jgi:hypothetical protein